jgi:transcription antitermination factor NusG
MLLCEHDRVTEEAGARPRTPPSSVERALPTGSPRWYALRTKSNAEFHVRARLAQNALDGFLPTWLEESQWNDRKKTIERVLFPGYVFASLHEGDEIRRARLIPGVVEILPNSLNPLAIDDREIDNVRLVLASKLEAAPCDFTTGETVVIDSGPLAGVKGVVVKTRGAMRVIVSVEMLRRSIKVELDAATLIKDLPVAA